MEISDELYARLDILGLIPNEVRKHNVGESNYSEHLIQPWAVWADYPDLSPQDYDIIKRVLRVKKSDSRRMDYEKIIHDCQEAIRIIDTKAKWANLHKRPKFSTGISK